MEQLIDKVLKRFSNFESALNGSKTAEIHKERLNAISSIKNQGFPDNKNEEWKFTKMTKNLDHFISPKLDLAISNLDKEKYSFKSNEAIEIYNLNGQWDLESVKHNISGLHILNFREAQFKFESVFNTHFNKILKKENNSFGDLNTAFMNDGLFIYVEKGKVIEKEIVIHILNNSNQSKSLSQPRALIISEESSQIKIVEKFVAEGSVQNFSNSCTEIFVGKNANLEHYKLQLDLGNNFHTGNTAVVQERDSVFTDYTFSTSGEMVRNNLDIDLNGEYIESNMFGAYFLNGSSHVDNHTTVNHAFPNCNSNELYKGIMEDKSIAVFNGKIFVRKDAQKTNAFQSNRNLLLSPDATIHTKPQLEIWADDVKCSHGATIGQLDKEQLFYLRSRGIPEKEAIAMLTHAFIGEVIEKITVDYVKDYVRSALNERMAIEY